MFEGKGVQPGALRLEAGAGSGKTRAIASGLLERLKEGTSAKEIICVTFTQEQSDELRAALNSAAKEAGLFSADIENIQIVTSHSLVRQLSRGQIDESTIISEGTARFRLLDSVRKFNTKHYGDGHIKGQVLPKMESAIHQLKEAGILPGDIDAKRVEAEIDAMCKEEGISSSMFENVKATLRNLVSVYADYETKKSKRGERDYDDLLLELKAKVETKEILFRLYGHVIVDGIHAMNATERAIIDGIGVQKTYVGDEKQAIYSFRGGSADPQNFESVHNLISGAQNVNYRNLPGISKYANEFYKLRSTNGHNHRRDFDNMVNARQGKATVKLLISDEPGDAAIAQLCDLLDKGEKNIGLLVRTNDQLRGLARKLDTLGIPYASTMKAYTSQQAKKDMITFIKALFSNDPDTIMDGLFTPFAGLNVQDAFDVSESYRAGKVTFEQMRVFAKKFFDLREDVGKGIMDTTYTHTLVAAFEHGQEYYYTAVSMLDGLRTYFNNIKVWDREVLVDYLSTHEDGYAPKVNHKNIMLMTVHKAKGKTFNTVLYVPKHVAPPPNAIELTVFSILKAGRGIDKRGENKNEPTRVDYVALTRPKNKLFIVVDKRLQSRYDIPGLIDVEEGGYLSAEQQRVLMLRKAEDSTYLGKKDWLTEAIYEHFKMDRPLSFTRVYDTNEAYRYLKAHILHIKEENDAFETGKEVHEMAAQFIGGTLKEEQVEGIMKTYLSHVFEIHARVSEKLRGRRLYVEHEFTTKLGNVFPAFSDSETQYTSVMDAVFTMEEGGKKRYLIVDFKTDKEKTFKRKHAMQLMSYRRLLSIEECVPEVDIDIAIGWIGLRNKDGSLTWELETVAPNEALITDTGPHIARYLSWRATPKKFRDAILEVESDESLYQRIAKDLSGRKEVVSAEYI